MDPLSIASAVLAVLGAIAGTSKALRKLRSANSYSQNDISQVINEVSNFTLLMELTKAHIDNSPSLSASTTANLEDQCRQAKEVLDEMNKILNDHFTHDPHGIASSRHRKHWDRLWKRLSRLPHRLRGPRDDIYTALTILQAADHGRAISNVFIRLDEIAAGFATADNVVEESQPGDITEDQNVNVSQPMADNNYPSQTDASESSQDVSAYATPNPERIDTLSVRSDHMLVDDPQESAIRIRATVGENRCEPWCSCQCHTRSNLRTPMLLRQVVGVWLMSYKSLAMPVLTQCDYHRCKRTAQASFALSYFFLPWFLSRIFTLMASWTSDRGSGISVSLRLPRVVPPDADIMKFVDAADIDGVKALFSRGEASPFDVLEDGRSALYKAVYRLEHPSKVAIAQLLVNEGADPTLQDRTGMSPIDIATNHTLALCHCTRDQFDAIFQVSIEDSVDSRAWTFLHKIVTPVKPFVNVVDYLAVDDSGVNVPDVHGRTALSWAAGSGNKIACSALIAHGAEVDKVDIWGYTPLLLGTYKGDVDCIRLLLEAGANPDVKTVFDETTLSFAIAAGNAALVSLLIDYGVDLNLRGENGRTGLHEAARQGHLSIVHILIDHGAELDIEDSRGCSPLEDVLTEGYSPAGLKLDEVAKYLFAKGARLTVTEEFTCKPHGTTDCYCTELIQNWVSTPCSAK